MKVKATKRGYDGTRVIEEGEEFDMPEGAKGSWFKPVKGDEPKPVKAPRGSGRAATVGELASEQSDLA